jgi:hypothetical protein
MKQITKVVTIMLALLLVPYFAPAEAAKAGAQATDIESLLDDYSRYLSTDTTAYKTAYSSGMADLVQERRDFYAEYYKTGLHLKLDTLESSFFMDDGTNLQAMDNVTRITAIELVTLYGHPIITKAEDYPLIMAAQWAIAHTENKAVQVALQEYVRLTTVGANESISQGVNITFRVQHEIDILSRNNTLQIIRDEFTDKEIDNGEGADNVTWVENHPVRQRPDFTAMLEYRIYHTPIEVLGQQLLDDYTRGYGQDDPNIVISATFNYNRTAAVDYARSYTSNTYATCPYGSGVFADISSYNLLYKDVWEDTIKNCNDCADFVSQALEAGGFKPDEYWNDQGVMGSYAWRVFDFTTQAGPYGPGLAYYLQSIKKAIVPYANATALSVGDLMYTDDSDLHVVMITGVSPVRYSAHTNDRLDKVPDDPETFTRFWHVKPALSETNTFADVLPTHPQWQYIERIYASQITAGCSASPLNYCPNGILTRAQMAVFILRGKYGKDYIPPNATGAMFNDVPINHWAGKWVEQLAREEITGGCGNGNFCPDRPITKAEMSVFLLRAKYGNTYYPDPAFGVFEDVPANYWAAAWIEQEAIEGIGYTCGVAQYCPWESVSRAKMALLLVRTFKLP